MAQSVCLGTISGSETRNSECHSKHHGGPVNRPVPIASRDLPADKVSNTLRDAFSHLAGIDGAEFPGEDTLLPAGPRVFPSGTIERLARTAERTRGRRFDAEVRQAIESRGTAALARSLGFEPLEVELIVATPSILPPPVRADFVPARQGHRLVEWNVDPCLGGIAGRMIFDCFTRAGVTRGLSFRDPAAALVPTFARLAGQVRGVIVVIREVDLPRWRLNAQRFAEIAREAGLESRVVPLERLGRHLSEAGTLPWGVVRFFHIEHVAESQRAECCASCRCGARWPNQASLYGFDTELWGDKQWLAQVPLKLKGDLARVVPETRTPRDITSLLSQRGEKWGSRRMQGGWRRSTRLAASKNAVDWRTAAVERSRKEPGWVAQRLVSPRSTGTAYVDVRSGLVMRRREIETLGIFLVEGRYAGAYVRSTPVDTGIVVDSFVEL